MTFSVGEPVYHIKKDRYGIFLQPFDDGSALVQWDMDGRPWEGKRAGVVMSNLRSAELPYDPTQQGDKEDDI